MGLVIIILIMLILVALIFIDDLSDIVPYLKYRTGKYIDTLADDITRDWWKNKSKLKIHKTPSFSKLISYTFENGDKIELDKNGYTKIVRLQRKGKRNYYSKKVTESQWRLLIRTLGRIVDEIDKTYGYTGHNNQSSEWEKERKEYDSTESAWSKDTREREYREARQGRGKYSKEEEFWNEFRNTYDTFRNSRFKDFNGSDWKGYEQSRNNNQQSRNEYQGYKKKGEPKKRNKNHAHPKWDRYWTLILNIRQRTKNLKELTSNDPNRKSLTNELNSAKRQAKKMKDKYNF